MSLASAEYRIANRSSRRLRVCVAWGYCLLLTYLLVTPAPLSPFGGWGQDAEEAIDRTFSSYLQHGFAYVGLVGWFWLAYPPKQFRHAGILVLGTGSHGILFEGLQYFIPFRYCDWPDLGCNLAGVALGATLVPGVLAFRQRILTRWSHEANGPCAWPDAVGSWREEK